MEQCKALLEEQHLTCVLKTTEGVYTSNKRGVAPLLEWIQNGVNAKGAIAADKVIGKAAAFLYVRLGVSQVYGQIVSKHARDILEQNEIVCSYDNLVEAIRNRDNTGYCPMETAVLEIEDQAEAYQAILIKREQLMGGK